MPSKISTEEKIYRFVCENPGNCTYDISRMLRMSGGKVRNALGRLEKKGMIKFRFERQNPRIRKLSYPVGAIELMPKDLRREIPNI
ncbi:hypothetical protein A3K63_03690 [Candidatus Micrarchaeota archaeon RBG_16_49_10]|nr:MAG: hypothetical protein A3K63_03690 [Candidatus Micrarchaeota archaeon RBG_16_49_10]